MQLSGCIYLWIILYLNIVEFGIISSVLASQHFDEEKKKYKVFVKFSEHCE